LVCHKNKETTDEGSHGVVSEYYDSLIMMCTWLGVHNSVTISSMLITLVVYLKGSLGEEQAHSLVSKS
jgi:hypothetical protein